MIDDTEASDDFMFGDDMAGYGLYIIEANDGPFYSYAQVITDFRGEFKVVSIVDDEKRTALEEEWRDSIDGAPDGPMYNSF